MNRAQLGSVLPLTFVVVIGHVGLALAWYFTARFGPWRCNAIASSICLLSAAAVRTWPNMRLSLQHVITGAVTALLLAAGSWAFAPLAVSAVPALKTELQGLLGTLQWAPGPTRASPILLLTVVTEELVWRDCLVRLFPARTPGWQIVLACTLTYAVPISVSGSWLLVLVALGLGPILVIQRLRSGTWMLPLVTHAAWSLLLFVVHPIGT